MLHAVAELAEHGVGHVGRILRDEVHAHALGADQPHHLLHLLQQRRRRVVEQQVRLVEEEGQLRLVQVAHLGQVLEQLRQHPQQEGRIQLGSVEQLVGRQDIDHALAAHGLHQVGNVEHRLAEKLVGALLLQPDQAALDGADAGRRDVAVLVGVLGRMLANVLQHRAQVLGVEQRQAGVVGDPEDEVEHAGLDVVELQHARQHQRAHVGHGGAHRVALFAVDVP